MIAIKANLAMPVNIGHQGENDARCVQFDLSEFQTEFPSGIPLLIVQRPNDTTIYPIALEVDGTTAIWTVTATETEYTGLGKCVLQWSVDDVIVKSCMYITMVAPSLTLGAGTMPDEPGKSWYEHILSEIGNLDNLTTKSKDNLVNAINEAAKTGSGTSGGTVEMRVSDGYIQYGDGTTWTDLIALSELKGTDGHTPEITAAKTDKTTTISVDGKAVAEIKDGENGTDGDDGYSPTASVSKSGTVTTVKITDKSGTTTAEIKDGEPGTNGTSVSISKISESAEDGGENVVTFNDGKTLTVKNGGKGSDGFSPSVTVSKSGAETTVTATDKSGTTSAVVKDGEDGYSPSAKVTKTDNGVKISITDKDGTTEQEVENGTCPEVGDDYELIETITLTEDVASVSRSVETDGTAYSFDGMKVCFKVPAASTVNSGFVKIGFCGAYNDNKPSAYVRLRESTTGRVSYASAEMRKKDGYWRAQIEEYFAGYSAPNISDRVNVQDHGKSYMHSWRVSENPKLTGLSIAGNSSWVIPNGTTIYIYAIRHDGAAGSGDMLSSDYDADGAVKTAGGIAKYVAENAGSGSGDMKQSDYDADGAVKSAGGIVKYAAGMVGVANGIAPLNASKKVPVANLPTSDSTSSSSSSTVATSKAVKAAYDLAKSAGSGISVSGATVGQTVKISAVDDSGVPTAWEAVDRTWTEYATYNVKDLTFPAVMSIPQGKDVFFVLNTVDITADSSTKVKFSVTTVQNETGYAARFGVSETMYAHAWSCYIRMLLLWQEGTQSFWPIAQIAAAATVYPDQTLIGMPIGGDTKRNYFYVTVDDASKINTETTAAIKIYVRDCL